MAASFEELIKGGRYSMSTKYNPAAFLPVSVYKHPYDNHAIIVKYLDSEQRGSRMALYKSQIKNNLCIFTKNRHNLLLNTQIIPPNKAGSTPQPTFLDIFLIFYAWLVFLRVIFSRKTEQSFPSTKIIQFLRVCLRRILRECFLVRLRPPPGRLTADGDRRRLDD